jgi:hypothetical protein
MSPRPARLNMSVTFLRDEKQANIMAVAILGVIMNIEQNYQFLNGLVPINIRIVVSPRALESCI